jgi:hypothetical protein
MRFYDAPDVRGRRVVLDANAGAPGEWPPPREPALAQVAGGLNPEGDPFEDASRRQVQLTGRDARGDIYGARIYLPHGGTGYGSSPARTRDAALLGNLQDRDPFEDCAGLAALQRLHDRHYQGLRDRQRDLDWRSLALAA